MTRTFHQKQVHGWNPFASMILYKLRDAVAATSIQEMTLVRQGLQESFF